MAETPVTFDRIALWVTLKLGLNDATMSFWNLVARNSPPSSLLFVAERAVVFYSYYLPSILGFGDYTLSVSLDLWRAGIYLETAEVSDVPLSVAGASPPLPPNVAALSSFRPDPPRPRVVARTYWPFLRREFMDSDTQLSVAGFAAVHFLTSLHVGVQDWGGSGFAVRMIRYIRHKSDGSDSRIIYGDTSLRIATQRRRLRGSQKAAWNREGR